MASGWAMAIWRPTSAEEIAQAFLAAFLAVSALAGAATLASLHFASLIVALRLRMASALGSCGIVFDLGREYRLSAQCDVDFRSGTGQ